MQREGEKEKKYYITVKGLNLAEEEIEKKVKEIMGRIEVGKRWRK